MIKNNDDGKTEEDSNTISLYRNSIVEQSAKIIFTNILKSRRLPLPTNIVKNSETWLGLLLSLNLAISIYPSNSKYISSILWLRQFIKCLHETKMTQYFSDINNKIFFYRIHNYIINI